MLNKLLCAAALAVVAVPIAAQEVYVIDSRHSHPQWEIRHMGMTPQRGSFTKTTGQITLDRAAKKASIEVAIDAASVRSWDNNLDAILKADRFFNVEKYPTITFKSTNVTFEGDHPSVIDGELTMLGITKPISLRVVTFKCGENPGNKKQMC
ncbi:MAG TPA: YceI family protein, partial [Casimicrobiaceae bacterium]|nr:YceI family protein [Casimicrobiaceae bacterium]